MDKVLTTYGPITTDFKVMARLIKRMRDIKSKKVIPHRLDCYEVGECYEYIKNKTKDILINVTMEIFNPSLNYPPHIDDGGISYFIPLEPGNFYINTVSYPIVPFDDGAALIKDKLPAQLLIRWLQD